MQRDAVYQGQNGEWFYYDETWSNVIGPFGCEQEARDNLARYILELDGRLAMDVVEYEPKVKGDLDCFKSFIIGAVIGFAVGILLSVLTIGIANASTTYIVQPGDTLAQIAKDHLGNWSKYKELAEINNLPIETIDGIDYVWLKVGQEILLSNEPESLSRSEAFLILDRLVKDRAKRFLKPPELSFAEATEGMFLYSTRIKDVSQTYNAGHRLTEKLEQYIKKLKTCQRALDYWYATKIPVGVGLAILEEDGDTFLEYGLWILALVEQESGYRNIRGQHGELGWYQVKPSSFEWYSKTMNLKTPHWSGVMEENIYLATQWVTTLFHRYLLPRYNDSWQHAMQEYNNGSLKIVYSQQVYQRYRKLKKIVNDRIANTH